MTFTLETFAILMTVVCILLAGRNSVHTWWTGIIACVAYSFVFYDAKLYADMILQAFFVGTSFYGWYVWHTTKDKPEVPITNTENGLMPIVVVASLFVAGAYGYGLSMFTDAAFPYIDSAVLSFSVAAQILLMQRKVENWILWIIVNTIFVPLCWMRDLQLTSVLYGFFWCHAWYAYYHWKNLQKVEEGV